MCRVFNDWGLLRLVATGMPGVMLERTQSGVRRYKLEGSGDFRSPECVALLQEADIVTTNPPFSLFRDYFGLLAAHGKRFLIVGPLNAVKYQSVFPMIKSGDAWLGAGQLKGFLMPDGGYADIGNARWFTNIGKNDRAFINLEARYDEAKYPRYDNLDAIEVKFVKDIPCDYDGVMGVPSSVLEKHCPAQFEITGIAAGQWGGQAGRSAMRTL